MEWRCPSPPPHDNFDKAPPVGDCYDYENLKYDPKTGNYEFIK
jgi:cytochrome c oxidase subunit 1